MSTDQIRYSLRRRLFAATVLLVALALGASFAGFERSARGVILDAVRSHLAARAREALEATTRFQAERTFTVNNWTEATAMGESLDSRDPKFAEDFLRRAVQDQGGAFSAVALVDAQARIVAAVRVARPGERRGVALDSERRRSVDLAPLRAALDGDAVGVGVADARQIDAGQPPDPQLVLAIPVRDFTGEVTGAVIAAVPADAFARLLGQIDGGERRFVPLVEDGGQRLVISLPGEDAARLAAAVGAATTGPGELEERLATGRAVFVVRTPVASDVPGWSAAVTVPRSDALQPLSRLRAILGGVFVLVLGLSAAASVIALRRAAQPLTAVAASMRQVAEGDLETRVPEVYGEELGHLVRSFNTMVGEVARSREALARTEALRKEMQIAHQIQTAILPSDPALPGYEIAARMKPADDVGGDLYDILPFDDTFWVLIGDVSGHGIHSGLVMMMAQAAAYGAIRDDPHSHPRDVIAAVNRVLVENVRKRMGRDDYLTVMAARHLGGGRFVASGSHQPIFIARAGGRVETIEPEGPWCGIVEDIAPRLVDYEFTLDEEDALCLITDGITEAKDGSEQMFGDVRLSSVLSKATASPATEVLSRVFSSVEAFAASQEDDMTAVVLKRTGPAHA